eukprot:TRINITY_DN6254_c0_g1_i2.p1 TRINITY_DN6254_c0_g1~~TRINITY_DN6254_c0_g1_i2.p1  ORF type:complete len:144 (+),score=38.25 TRINITY_DN6254_c0_g1_i2:90-521(+)
MALPAAMSKMFSCGLGKGAAVTTPVSTLAPAADASPATPCQKPLPHLDSLQLTRKRLGWKPKKFAPFGALFEKIPSLSSTCSSSSLDFVEQVATSSTSVNSDYDSDEQLADEDHAPSAVQLVARSPTGTKAQTSEQLQHELSL